MRKIIGLCLGLWALGAAAQADDTAILRANNVSAIYKYQYVHAFDKSKDTCLFELTKLNKDAKIVFNSKDYRCMGFKGYEASELTYQKGNIKTVKAFSNGEMWSITENFYAADEQRPERVKVFFYQTNDSLLRYNTYFYSKKGRLDSTFTNEIRQDGSTYKTWTFARHNKKDELVQLYTTDSTYVPLQSVTYELDKKGKVLSMSYQTYGEKARFSQTQYGYNQKGQLVSTDNQAEQSQVYIYAENGLLSNILSYNPEGKLEVEYILKYEYHDK